MSKVPNEDLLRAGLQLMESVGQPLQRIETRGRAMIYRTFSGETVRVRTCNDHVLVALAESVSNDARLNIEGTDKILLVMPEVPRSQGKVMAFLVPTDVAVEAVRMTHRDWLSSKPQTNGNNRTWNIWFGDDAPSKANGFARKWAQYRLNGSATTKNSEGNGAQSQAGVAARLGDVIANAKQRIAEVAGVPESAVRITLDLT